MQWIKEIEHKDESIKGKKLKLQYFPNGKVDRTRLSFCIMNMDSLFTPVLSSMVVMEKYLSKLSEFADLFFIVKDGIDVGECAVYMNLLPNAYITSIALLPEYQGMGWGSKLLHGVREEAYKKGFECIFLQVHMNNFAALRLYKKFGFITVGEKKDFIKMCYRL